MKTIVEGVLAGVVIAGLVDAGRAPRALDPVLGGATGSLVATALVLAACAFLARAGRDGRTGRGSAISG
jgi:hypothetical protein